MKLVERSKVSSDEVIHISVFSDKTIVRRDHMENETYTGLSEALQALKTRYVQLPEEGIDQQTPEPFACLIRACEAVLQEEQIRRDRQLREVRKARRDGIIGRPVTPCREDFLKLTYLHDKKMVTAMEATRMDIGVAISCRTKRRYQEDEGWKI